MSHAVQGFALYLSYCIFAPARRSGKFGSSRVLGPHHASASMLECLVRESVASYVTHAWFSRIVWTLVAACVLTFHPKRDRVVRRVCSTAGAASCMLLRRARPAQRCTAPSGLLDYLPAEVLPGL